MMDTSWLPVGHQLCPGSSTGPLIFGGSDWQIVGTQQGASALLVTGELRGKWVDMELLESNMFNEVNFGSESYYVIMSPSYNGIRPVEEGLSESRKDRAMAFARAFRESRQLVGDVPLHDAIYVEHHARLLPTWSLSPILDDAMVLGRWVSKGVPVSINSIRRFAKITEWLPKGAAEDIVRVAGLEGSVASGGKSSVGTSASDSSAPRDGDDRDNSGTDPKQCDDEAALRSNFTLPGRPTIEKFLNEHVVEIVANPDRYKKFGISSVPSIVLCGPPGCGKTFAVDRLVEYLDWPSYSIDSGSIGSPYIHATSKKIAEVFEHAIDEAPSVVVIDEMEAFLPDRQMSRLSGTHRIEEVGEFLRHIPKAVEQGVLVVAMTNMLDLIDPAILRRGRFDHIIEVEMPSRVEVESVLKSLLGKMPTEDGLKLGTLLDGLTGRALSDTAFVVREAARLSARAGSSAINQQCLDEALQSLPEVS